MLTVVLLLNAIWFAMGFNAFYLRRTVFAKVVVPNKQHRDNSAYEAVIETGRFMGGFNINGIVTKTGLHVERTILLQELTSFLVSSSFLVL